MLVVVVPPALPDWAQAPELGKPVPPHELGLEAVVVVELEVVVDCRLVVVVPAVVDVDRPLKGDAAVVVVVPVPVLAPAWSHMPPLSPHDVGVGVVLDWPVEVGGVAPGRAGAPLPPVSVPVPD